MPSFFFSSRRRHTRSLRDWSSDVCSSDLTRDDVLDNITIAWLTNTFISGARLYWEYWGEGGYFNVKGVSIPRSEERRVGKECSCWWSADRGLEEDENRAKSNRSASRCRLP